jgi:LPS O-antigen subunit length determinant protein (WzzB/FepE family)
MNKHIELVKKWLADPKSVTQQELNDNRDAAAYAAYDAAYVDYAAAADYAAHAAAYAAYTAYDAAYYNADAAYWVKRYEEITNE